MCHDTAPGVIRCIKEAGVNACLVAPEDSVRTWAKIISQNQPPVAQSLIMRDMYNRGWDDSMEGLRALGLGGFTLGGV